MYPFLSTIFILTVISGVVLAVCLNVRRWRGFARRLLKKYLFWLATYAFLIAVGTGPSAERTSLPETSPYKLPWSGGVSRFVSQGNLSFTSHRGNHENAWDFWMSIGTEVRAARDGTVIEVEQSYSGLGPKSNFVLVEHADETKALYAHIKTAKVQVGDAVKQGEPVAQAGMVGPTINPHLHFVVFNKDQTASLPITFADVAEDGVPRAGHFYSSGNVP